LNDIAIIDEIMATFMGDKQLLVERMIGFCRNRSGAAAFSISPHFRLSDKFLDEPMKNRAATPRQ
jgi:hypothetical protein